MIDSHTPTLSHIFDIVNKTAREIEKKTNKVIQKVGAWLDEAGLTLTAHKMEPVLISDRKIVERMEVTVGDTK